MTQRTTRWEATATPGLYVRQPGGGFYARITLNGKRSWRSLKTDKLREAQKLLRDLQSGHTRQVSTRTDDKLHAAMTAVIEFRAIRRSLKSRQLKKTTTAFHADILERPRSFSRIVRWHPSTRSVYSKSSRQPHSGPVVGRQSSSWSRHRPHLPQGHRTGLGFHRFSHVAGWQGAHELWFLLR